ncbi:MAG: amidohydrolase family protein [Gemmatimonadales bacterium]
MSSGDTAILRRYGMRYTLRLHAAALWFTMLVAAPLAAQRPSYDVQLPEGQGSYPTGDLFIANIDTVWTAAGDPIAGASILIRNGIIREIGMNLSPPGNVTIIDGAGLQAMPGIVDEHSHIAMAATNEGTAPVVPEVRVLDALDAESYGIYQALSGGVTTARIMHGSSNPIGGQSAVVKTRWGMERGEQLLIPGAPKFVKFALGENVTRKGNPQSDRFPRSRPGVEAVYVEAFTAAQAYKAKWAEYEANRRAFRVPPRRDLRLEALVDIMDGKIRIHAHSYRSDEILMLMRIAERFGFRIDVFTHVLEGYRIATEMAAHGAAGSTFSDWWQYKREAFDAIPFNAAIMQQHGVLTGLNSDIPWLQSFMHLEIAKPVKWGGVSKLEALRMLTLNPARMMYIDDKVGSLEVGKQADVVLLTASPFNSYARVEKTIVDGIVYYDASDEAGTRDQPFNAFPTRRMVPVTTPGISSGSAAGTNGGSGTLSTNGGANASQETLVALVGGTVHPVSGQPIENGTLLFQGGRIQAVGRASEVSVPAGARRVDVTGKHVYPGMIDPLTTIGLFEFGQVGQATDQSELGRYNPHIRAISGVMPHYPSLNVARANGITTVLTAQTSGMVQGTAAVIGFNDGDTWEKVAVKPEAALMVNFPAPREQGGGSTNWMTLAGDDDLHGGTTAAANSLLDEVEAAARAAAQEEQDEEEEDQPKLTGTRMEELVSFFRRARVYRENPSVSDDPTAPFEANVWGGESVLMDAMMPAMRGEMPVFFRAASEWQIRTLFVFADSFPEIRPVVVGGSGAWKVADELAAREMPVIVTSAYTPSSDRDESLQANFRNASLLESAGVRFAFGTGSDADVRRLPYHAAHSVAYGLSPEGGLRAVTLNAADILGIEAGSLEVGKRADVIVTDGDPLQILANVEMMWVGGEEVDPKDNKHQRLFEQFRGR